MLYKRRTRQCRVPTIDRGRDTALPCPLCHSNANGINIRCESKYFLLNFFPSSFVFFVSSRFVKQIPFHLIDAMFSSTLIETKTQGTINYANPEIGDNSKDYFTLDREFRKYGCSIYRKNAVNFTVRQLLTVAV